MSSSHGQTMLAALNGLAEILMETPGRTLLLLDEPDMALSIRSVHHLARLLQSQDPKDAGPAQVH